MIEVKYNINFKKALKLFREDKLTKFTNNKLAPQTAKEVKKYFTSLLRLLLYMCRQG